MATETFDIVVDGTSAGGEFYAQSPEDLNFSGSPTLREIKNIFVAGGWSLTDLKYAVGKFFVRDLPVATFPPLPEDLKSPPLSCDGLYFIGYNYNGVPATGLPIVPYDPGAHTTPPGCAYHELGLDFDSSLANFIAAINSYTAFVVTGNEPVPGYAHGHELTLTAKEPGPDSNYIGFWGNGWHTAARLQPQNGGYTLRSETYRGSYLEVTLRESDYLTPARIWFDVSLNATAVFKQPVATNLGYRYRMAASPLQFLVYVPKEHSNASAGGPTTVFASVPWRAAESPVSGGAFVTGNWDYPHQFSRGQFRDQLTWGETMTAASLDGEAFSPAVGFQLTVPSLHTVPGSPVKNIQGNAISQNAFLAAKQTDGTYDTKPMRLLGKIWNSMVLPMHFDVTQTDMIEFNRQRWMLVSSQSAHQQASLWMRLPDNSV